ncbi:MAG: hypothetical protein KKB30_14610, partial [Proteobacteria bacterium]|nr:hypothetical protein [Pseudomonadota bacterium]MBU1717134.1 hypothetical protein [Pseudomonadota bacterium]
MQRNPIIFFLLLIIPIIFSSLTSAADLSVERELQSALKQSQALLIKIKAKQDLATPITDELAKLHSLAAEIRT